MRERLRAFHESIRSHILFIPGVLVLLGVAAAIVLVEADRRLETDQLREIPWVFRAGASGARQVLATIATSMAQLAGITFSVTIVALALRSQQFGPRLLRNFTKDRLNQVILGAFVATFVFALLVLRAVRDLEENGLPEETFVPLLAVTFSIVLALVSLGFFVIFIDRVVDSMQADTIVSEAAKETSDAIEELFPEPIGSAEDEDPEPGPDLPLDAVRVPAAKAGYVQSIRAEHLMETAAEHRFVLYMAVPVGAFVAEGEALAVLEPGNGHSEAMIDEVRKSYRIGRNRTVVQDPEYGLRQIADIAVKALSPSQNDPNTAVTAVEYLSAVLRVLADRRIPDWRRRDEEGEVRVIALGPTFRSMMAGAFDQIREHARGDVAVSRTLLASLGRIAERLESGHRREIVRDHLRKVSRAADEDMGDPQDRRDLNRAFEAVQRRTGLDLSECLIPEIPERREAAGRSSA